MAQRHDLARAKHLGGVGLGAQGAQIGRRDVVHVQRQDLKRQVGVALLVVDAAPAVERGVVHLGVVLRQVQATVGCQAFEQDFAETLAVGVATGREVAHQASSSLRMRVMGASTVGSACIWAKASFMVPSRVSWVRMMTSV